ncbi:MAG: cytochrome family [Thermoleophilaceae bacterium]|nr:cytochrome family [Thermoleophilaceae bacterium]
MTTAAVDRAQSHAPKGGPPPGPPLPALVQTLGFMFAPARYIEACRRRYGNVVTFSTKFDSNFVMVFEPEAVKKVFQAPPDRLHAGKANELLGPALGERSVLLLDGDEHMRQRKLMLPPFHGKRLKAYEGVMSEATDRAIDGWPVGDPFALLPSMQVLTLEVIMRTVFGVEDAVRREELKRRVRAMLEPLSRRLGILVLALSRGRFGSGGAMQRFRERRAALDELLFEEIARRRAEPDLEQRDDVFSMLVLARDENGAALSDTELRDELVTLLVAGHETTATGLAWTFERLLRTPRVLAELKRRLADGDETYLDAVVKESLRVRPVIPGIGRVVQGDQPFELGGYEIPPGIEINPSIYGVHRLEMNYPRAGEFRPERFLEDDPPDTYTWIPFGGGIRRCLGASFALMEMRTVVRRVLERTELEAVGHRHEQIERQGITMVPKNGVRVVQPSAPR